MILRFIGKDKSMGLRKDELYPVKIMSQAVCDNINILILRGDRWVACEYSSPQTFAENWSKP